MRTTGENRRRQPRRRTRLRSGKVATLANRFIIECQIFDRSAEGARLRLAGRVVLPDHVKLFDDERNALYVAKVVWRRGNEVGIAFPEGLDRCEVRGAGVAALSGKYYAV